MKPCSRDNGELPFMIAILASGVNQVCIMITSRCGSGVPLGVSGSPTDAFHWCGPIPPAVGVHAAEEYADAVKVGVEVAVAFVTAPTLSSPKHVIMTIT
jgi:hypothetical protein